MVPSSLLLAVPQSCSLDLHPGLLLWPLQGRYLPQPCLLVLGVIPLSGHLSWDCSHTCFSVGPPLRSLTDRWP